MADLTVEVRHTGLGKADAFHLDEYSGTDDQKWDLAEAAQKAATARNMPPIVLPHRPITLTRPRSFYSGQKVIGLGSQGQKNPELAGGNYVGPEITLAGTIGKDGASLFNGTGGSIYDVHMSGFSVQGSQGSAKHQFADVPSGTLYACHFDSLAFNMMAGVFGNGANRKCLMTQVALTGSWTMNNAWDTQLNVGGSDCVFFMDSFANVGTSGSSAQTGDVNRYYFRFDSLEATIGKAYLSTLNGWRGLLISGAGSSVDLHGGVYEGYKPTRQNGLLSGPGPGTQIRITGGAVSMHGTKVGQGMDNPDPSEGGLIQVDGGEVHLSGVTVYGRNLATVPAVKVNGGRVSVAGLLRRQNESAYWTGRPLVSGATV